MALDSTEQELFDFAWQAMPLWFRARERAAEELGMQAKMMGAVKKQLAYWLGQCKIGTAAGPTGSDPDWLQWHAEDRGTNRANGETDATMRLRISQVPEAVSRESLLAAAQAIVDAAGVVGTAAMVELPRDAAYLGSVAQDGSAGGGFSKSGDTMTFWPTTPFAFPPYVDGISGRVKAVQLVLSGCDEAGNDGTFDVTGLDARDDLAGNPTLTAVHYTNAAGVAGADSACSWSTSRLDVHDQQIDGWSRAYVNRGYRACRGGTATQAANAGMVIILPYGCTEAHRLAVREMLRQKKAAGFAAIVERRSTP